MLLPASSYLFRVIIRNTRTRCEICSKLAICSITPERRHWSRSGLFINIEHILHFVLVFLLLTLSRLMPAGLFLCIASSLVSLAISMSITVHGKLFWRSPFMEFFHGVLDATLLLNASPQRFCSTLLLNASP